MTVKVKSLVPFLHKINSQPGLIFETDELTAKALVDSGQAEYVQEKVNMPDELKADTEQTGSKYKRHDLQKKTVMELRSIASEEKVTGITTKNKKQLIKAILEVK